MIAVTPIPTKTPSNGLENFVMKLVNSGIAFKGSTELDMIPIPKNKIPIPAINKPKLFDFLFLTKMIMITPTIEIIAANFEKSNAINCVVKVVPILAPMMI